MTFVAFRPLVYPLLDLADRLILTRGGSVEQAALRRAVSTAYYAVFHALCSICAAELVGWSRTEQLQPIYRSLDHGVAVKRLMSPDAKAIHEAIVEAGLLFKLLQAERHNADYKAPAALYKRSEARALVEEARRAVALLDELDPRHRLALAVLLIAKR